MKCNTLLITLLVLICQSCIVGSGFYPYAEKYVFDIYRDELIDNVDKFKEENPEYKVMTTFQSGIIGEHDGINGGFYNFYFYFKSIDSKVHCIINMSEFIDEKPTYFMLASISRGKEFRGEAKMVNTKDLTRKENKEIKNLFETEILDHIGISWKRERWWK